MNESMPPGTYRDESGQARYWDGTQWLQREESAPPAPPPPPSTKRGGKVTALAGIVVLILLVGSWYAWNATSDRNMRNEAKAEFERRGAAVRSFLPAVGRRCSDSGGVEASERYMTVDGEGDEDWSGTSLLDVLCIVEGIEMTPSARSRFESTNSLQGLVEDSWTVLNGDATLDASWSYHPDSGVNLSVELKSPFLDSFDYEKHAELVD